MPWFNGRPVTPAQLVVLREVMRPITHLRISKEEDERRAQCDTACGRCVPVTYASRHRVAVNCKRCLNGR
jgi:hypothetical protein